MLRPQRSIRWFISQSPSLAWADDEADSDWDNGPPLKPTPGAAEAAASPAGIDGMGSEDEGGEELEEYEEEAEEYEEELEEGEEGEDYGKDDDYYCNSC